MSVQTLQLDGKPYVLLDRVSYDQLKTLAKVAKLPDPPEPDAKGNYPAVDSLRASIARDIIQDRVEAGLSQKELANLAGMRVETLCRIETGKHTPSVASVDKIDAALKKAVKRRENGYKPGARRGRGKAKAAIVA